MQEAVRAGLIEPTEAIRRSIWSRLDGPLDWPDVMHGAAGQGIAALETWPDRAAACAEYLIRTQHADGSWSIPGGFGSLSGQKLTGFAHGVAGIVYFLAEFAHSATDRHAETAWRNGVRWLEGQAVANGAGLIEWPYSNKINERWRWWCHGAPGIALAYLRLHEITREAAFLDVATKALAIHPARIRYGNLSYCHGLTGLGEIYLEAYRITRDASWLSRAYDVLETIMLLARKSEDRGVTWAVEDPKISTGDLGVGCSGVVHFLLRLHEGVDKVGLPLAPDPPQPHQCIVGTDVPAP